VTGESIPVEKSGQDQVFAGTLNGEGMLIIEATRRAGESTISRILQMIEDAQARKSPLQKLSERFEAIFVPLALLLVVFSAVLPPLLGEPFHLSLYRALALLVAASPCSLAIATPSAVLAAIACAAHNGVLIKGGEYLEEIGSVKAMAFDKTGTVTQGRPRIILTEPAPGVSEEELLTLAAAIESRSAHPLARAFTEAVAQKALILPEVTDLVLIPGRGVEAVIAQDLCLIGNRALMKERGIELPGWCTESLAHSEEKGMTTVLASRADRLMGVLGISDMPRLQAKGAFAALKRLGVEKLLLLTGDNEVVARAVARETGIDDVRSGLLPEDKVNIVESLKKDYGSIAMVGDGINDAPAMAHSTIAIAMGSAGTDVAMETADIALMSDNLAKIPFAVGLGRFTVSVIRQNLALALGIMAVLVLSVVTGKTGITGAVIFHEGGTLLVVMNALRILGFREKTSGY
jgi:Cd2+/Zn2+-exporting ATPase